MARTYPRRVWMGIDPGAEGGIGIIPKDGNPSAFLMPSTREGLCNLLRPYQNSDVIVVVEKVHSMPHQGVASTFKFGKAYGEVLGICSAFGFHIIDVRPQEWKAKLIPRVADKSDKVESIKRSKQLFPQVSLVPPGCRTDYDGIAEGLLMAEYCRRYY